MEINATYEVGLAGIQLDGQSFKYGDLIPEELIEELGENIVHRMIKNGRLVRTYASAADLKYLSGMIEALTKTVNELSNMVLNNKTPYINPLKFDVEMDVDTKEAQKKIDTLEKRTTTLQVDLNLMDKQVRKLTKMALEAKPKAKKAKSKGKK